MVVTVWCFNLFVYHDLALPFTPERACAYAIACPERFSIKMAFNVVGAEI